MFRLKLYLCFPVVDGRCRQQLHCLAEKCNRISMCSPTLFLPSTYITKTSNNSDQVAQHALDILHLRLRTATSTLVFPNPHEAQPQPPDAEQMEEDAEDDILADTKELEVEKRRLRKVKKVEMRLQDLLQRETG